jgi:diguanylate cyclase (GGDEF)-like protein
VTALATVMPHPAELEAAGFLAVAALQAAAAVAVYLLPRDFQRANWLGGAIVGLGIFAVTACVYFNGERHGGPPYLNEFFYVWPAFYIGYFLRPRGVALGLALIAALYALVLSRLDLAWEEAFTRWVVTVTTVSFVAIVLRMLRARIDRLVGQLRETAQTDPLTMVLNRRGFDERMELELERARRNTAPLGLLMADLDHFKEVNDRFGHAAGDTVLACVGQALVLGCRSIDTVARIGGEEFAVLLPGTDAAGALDAAERLRAEIGRVEGDGVRGLTLSVGVVEFPRDGRTPEDLLEAADRALYAAKAEGRDRAVVYGRPENATA